MTPRVGSSSAWSRTCPESRSGGLSAGGSDWVFPRELDLNSSSLEAYESTSRSGTSTGASESSSTPARTCSTWPTRPPRNASSEADPELRSCSKRSTSTRPNPRGYNQEVLTKSNPPVSQSR